MHTIGHALPEVTGVNLIYAVIINGIFNTGVTLFMLISGYFGVRRSAHKIFQMEALSFFYSLLGLCVFLLVGRTLHLGMIEKAIFPVLTEVKWYITVYMLLLLLSPYLNRWIEGLTESSFRRVLLLLIGVSFLVTPFPVMP